MPNYYKFTDKYGEIMSLEDVQKITELGQIDFDIFTFVVSIMDDLTAVRDFFAEKQTEHIYFKAAEKLIDLGITCRTWCNRS